LEQNGYGSSQEYGHQQRREQQQSFGGGAQEFGQQQEYGQKQRQQQQPYSGARGGRLEGGAGETRRNNNQWGDEVQGTVDRS